jgi:uncharacterized Zn finger protein (UPF0148 family)
MYGRTDGMDEKPRMLEENAPCPHCGIRNPTGYVSCFSCGQPTNGDKAKCTEDKRYANETLNLIAQDKDLAKKFSNLLQEAIDKVQSGNISAAAGSAEA